jgi:hypothetical protein
MLKIVGYSRYVSLPSKNIVFGDDIVISNVDCDEKQHRLCAVDKECLRLWDNRNPSESYRHCKKVTITISVK